MSQFFTKEGIINAVADAVDTDIPSEIATVFAEDGEVSVPLDVWKAMWGLLSTLPFVFINNVDAYAEVLDAVKEHPVGRRLDNKDQDFVATSLCSTQAPMAQAKASLCVAFKPRDTRDKIVEVLTEMHQNPENSELLKLARREWYFNEQVGGVAKVLMSALLLRCTDSENSLITEDEDGDMTIDLEEIAIPWVQNAEGVFSALEAHRHQVYGHDVYGEDSEPDDYAFWKQAPNDGDDDDDDNVQSAMASLWGLIDNVLH